MDVVEIKESLFVPKGSGVPRSSAHATGKLHLSDIARYIDYKMGYTKRSKGVEDWDMHLAAEVGFLWEDVLSRAFADRYAARIGEVETDGVIGSPDGLSPNDPRGRVILVNEEYKATWRSTRKTPSDIWYWETQFKSYCYMLDVNVTVARVLYLMGDYKGSGPQYKVFRIEFTPFELRENWKMILEHRDEMVEKGYKDFQDAVKGEKFNE
jgi:hypothetical protein